jgi:predicted RNA-binding protein with RPS1 domain
VVVDENEHGFIVKSFGGIKGLLTFADIKENGGNQKDLKVGSIVKAYILFRKKDKGMALTLDKTKAKELRKGQEEKTGYNEGEEKQTPVFTRLEQYFPSQE